MDPKQKSSGHEHLQLMPGTLGNRLGILWGTFLVMLLIVSLLGNTATLAEFPPRWVFMMVSILQCLLVFILPSWITAFVATDAPCRYLGLTRYVRPRQFAGVVLLFVCLVPALNALVAWNAGVHLPGYMYGLEKVLRTLEDQAAATTQMVLSNPSAGALAVNILVVGLLTGFAEEMFFRAGLQKALTAGRIKHHAAIWLTAFIFSAIHFQFFGFVPRLLLGALFGYLFYYTGSLWVAAFAHALNNTCVVVMEWLKSRQMVETGFDSIGVEGPYAIVWIIASCLLTAAFIVFLWKRFFNNGKGN